MDEYIITQEDLNQGNVYLQTLTTEHPVCRIADGVTTIGDNTFQDCTGLTSIAIPDSVVTIGEDVFTGCTGLTTIYVSESFDQSLLTGKIPEGVTVEVEQEPTPVPGTVEELITLNQLKTYDDVKTNLWHNNFTTNNLTADNYVGNNATVTDLNVTNLVATNAGIDNGIANNFNVAELVANNANIESVAINVGAVNNITIEDGTVNNFNVANFVATNAEIDNENVNNLNAGNMSINNLFVDNLIANEQGLYVDDLTVNNSAIVNGNTFTHKGFDVTSMTVIPEDDYNNLGDELRNQAFYVTSPNGNMYLHGMQWSPSYVPKEYTVYVDLHNMAWNMRTLTTSTLTFTTGAVTNSLINGGAYNGIWEKTPVGELWNNSGAVGTQANTGSIITNAKELYITNAQNMFYNCASMTDCFLSNSALITNTPENYDPLKYCICMKSTFYGCTNFNQPVTIGNNVINMADTFYGCTNFNQPVTIPDSVERLDTAFAMCSSFNQPVTIGNNVKTLSHTFSECSSFNQPVTISDSVTTMVNTFFNCRNFNQLVVIGNNVNTMDNAFLHCHNFNQPVIIPDSVTNMCYAFAFCDNLNQPVTIGNNVNNIVGAFYRCSSFNQSITIPESVIYLGSAFQTCTTLASSTVPIHISKNIAIGDTSNYIYSCLVNNFTGINWTGRILNDA